MYITESVIKLIMLLLMHDVEAGRLQPKESRKLRTSSMQCSIRSSSTLQDAMCCLCKSKLGRHILFCSLHCTFTSSSYMTIIMHVFANGSALHMICSETPVQAFLASANQDQSRFVAAPKLPLSIGQSRVMTQPEASDSDSTVRDLKRGSAQMNLLAAK